MIEDGRIEKLVLLIHLSKTTAKFAKLVFVSLFKSWKILQFFFFILFFPALNAIYLDHRKIINSAVLQEISKY